MPLSCAFEVLAMVIVFLINCLDDALKSVNFNTLTWLSVSVIKTFEWIYEITLNSQQGFHSSILHNNTPVGVCGVCSIHFTTLHYCLQDIIQTNHTLGSLLHQQRENSFSDFHNPIPPSTTVSWIVHCESKHLIHETLVAGFRCDVHTAIIQSHRQMSSGIHLKNNEATNHKWYLSSLLITAVAILT